MQLITYAHSTVHCLGTEYILLRRRVHLARTLSRRSRVQYAHQARRLHQREGSKFEKRTVVTSWRCHVIVYSLNDLCTYVLRQLDIRLKLRNSILHLKYPNGTASMI